ADDGDLVLAAAGKSTPSGFDREHAALKNDPHVENVITSWAGGAGWAGRAGSAGRAEQHEGKDDSQLVCPRSARPLARARQLVKHAAQIVRQVALERHPAPVAGMCERQTRGVQERTIDM